MLILDSLDSARSTATPTSTTSSPSSTSATPPSSPTQDLPPSAATNTSATSSYDNSAFHYYFLIVAVIAVAVFLCVLYIGRRKKRKAELIRSNSQRALARDVEGFRRFGRGRNGLGWPTSTPPRHRRDVEEGLDERGEAPPPYVPGTKPPSLRTVERETRPSTNSGHAEGEAVEMRRMSREVEHPPGYNDHSVSESPVGVTRPDTAVLASERFSSARRLINHTGSLPEQDRTVVR